MFHRTSAVCLRKVDWSETSQVLRFFTPGQGKISCVAKGAKRKKSAFLAPFDVLAIYDLIRIEKRPGTLDILTAAERVKTYPALVRDFGRFSAACYAAEFVDEFTKEGMPADGVYELLVELLERLESGVPVADALFSFEIRGLDALGFLPRLRECGVCRKPTSRQDLTFSTIDGGAVCPECRPDTPRRFHVRRASLESLARFAEGDMPKKAMERSLTVEIRRILDALVVHHLERELRSARFLQDALVR